jgi:hypothetical protein
MKVLKKKKRKNFKKSIDNRGMVWYYSQAPYETAHETKGRKAR